LSLTLYPLREIWDYPADPDSLSASTLRTKRRMYPKKKPTEVTRPKKAAKESNKPKGP